MKVKAKGLAIIGASYRSTMLLQYLKKYPNDGYIAGFFDLIPERCHFFIEKYGLENVRIYSSIEQAVEDKAVDAVFIGTSDSQHVEPSVKALRAGKDVYCEKPMAITLDDCDKIIQAAREANSVFYLGMNLRHGPVHEKIHQIIQSGEIGKVLTIEANEYYAEGRSYFRRWNRLIELSGGLWVTKACHDFDLLNWMAAAKPTRVFATSSLSYYKNKKQAGRFCRECKIKTECPDYYDVMNPQNALQNDLLEISEKATGVPRDLCLYNSDKDTFDNGIAVIEYENDIRATYTVNVVSGRNTRQMRVMGTLGSLEGDMEAGVVKVWPRYSSDILTYDVREKMKSSHGGADDRILKDFFCCCRTGCKPRSSWTDGRLGVQVALAARKSCDQAAVVSVEDV